MDQANPIRVPSRQGGVALPRVGVLVVTRNRKAMVEACLRAIAGQTYPGSRLDVVVVDNASGDGTCDHLLAVWKPERVMQNSGESSSVPGFALGKGAAGGNAGRWRSLTLVRNQHNLGACGGFNTAFLMVERTIAAHRVESMVPEDPRAIRAEPMEYLWLLEDDAEPASDCLERLVDTARADERVGIVGSRLVEARGVGLAEQSVLRFDPATGAFGATGPIECVPACSMLARWAAARQVGYWDSRFFNRSGAADWCLRFHRAGLRAIRCEAAEATHPTRPASGGIAGVADQCEHERNLLWIWERSLGSAELKRAAKAHLKEALGRAWRARKIGVEGEMRRRAIRDAILGRAGPLEPRVGEKLGAPGAIVFTACWVLTWARCRWYVMRVKPREFGGKFGAGASGRTSGRDSTSGPPSAGA